MKQKQEWVCEGCGLSGATKFNPGDGVFAAFYAIRDHHETLASKYAPLCHFDVNMVRVRNPDFDKYEWNRLVAEIEKKTRERPGDRLRAEIEPVSNRSVDNRGKILGRRGERGAKTKWALRVKRKS